MPPESGLLHALDLILKPFPQEAVQCDQAAQSCHSEAMPAIELLAPPEALYARVYLDQAVRPLFIFSLKRKEKEKEDTERGKRKEKEERLGIREILTRGGSRRHRRLAGTSEEWQGDCLGIGKYEKYKHCLNRKQNVSESQNEKKSE